MKKRVLFVGKTLFIFYPKLIFALENEFRMGGQKAKTNLD